MSIPNDGGPAFATIDRPMYDKDEHHPGLSKLEWFAGMALSGYAANPNYDAATIRDLARGSFDLAQAMLAESERRSGE